MEKNPNTCFRLPKYNIVINFGRSRLVNFLPNEGPNIVECGWEGGDCIYVNDINKKIIPTAHLIGYT